MFDLWALWGAEDGSGRGVKSWCRDCWYCFYRQLPADAGIGGKLGAMPSLLSAHAWIPGTPHPERLVQLSCAGCRQSFFYLE